MKVEYFSCTADVQVILLSGLAGDHPTECVRVRVSVCVCSFVKVEELIRRALHLNFAILAKTKTKNPDRQKYIYSPT